MEGNGGREAQGEDIYALPTGHTCVRRTACCARSSDCRSLMRAIGKHCAGARATMLSRLSWSSTVHSLQSVCCAQDPAAPANGRRAGHARPVQPIAGNSSRCQAGQATLATHSAVNALVLTVSLRDKQLSNNSTPEKPSLRRDSHS